MSEADDRIHHVGPHVNRPGIAVGDAGMHSLAMEPSNSNAGTLAMNATELSGRIMVVDDHEPNRLLLHEILEARGYVVDLCAGGEEAIARIGITPPDLLLLDVGMPGVNGFDVCRRLRADSSTASLPIILVTAFTSRDQRLEGIAAGANDYLTKPIDQPELLLRVRNALQLRRLHRALADQYDQLRRSEEMRDALVHMMVHDLRSPLSGMLIYSELIKDKVTSFSDQELTDDLEDMRCNVRLLADMVSNVLDVNRCETAEMPVRFESVDLHATAREAIATLGRADARRVSLFAPTDPVHVPADADLVRRVIANLVGNAVKFSPSGAEVRVDIARRDSGAMVQVTDAGPGIPPEHHLRIFDKFAQVESDERLAPSSGLGLTFCKLAVEAHGGAIGVDSGADVGSVFWFRLPGRS